MGKNKRFEIKTACPQCGCSAVSHLSREEMLEKYGNVANVEMECSACRARYEAPMKEACPEWDKECRLNQ